MSVIWKGSRELSEQFDSPEVIFGDTTQKVYRFEGPHELCLSSAPRKGMRYGGFPVVQSRVRKWEAGKGELEVTTETSDFQASSSAGSRRSEIYEIDWVTVEKPLISHPIYEAGGDQVLTVYDRLAIENWKLEENATKRSEYKFRPILSVDVYLTLTTAAQHYAERYSKGIDSYQFSYPVARISSLYDTEPSTLPCNVYRASKPFGGCPSGYTWLKSVDRATRSGTNGRWVRNVEYQGFADLDTDLYASE
ncbi:hypothetical protein P0Y35_08755 [Kiritimatiellaeota bacterium B1221]|nr:hypothetical protein [Kiritimatiellaeota bacterium B1221]